MVVRTEEGSAAAATKIVDPVIEAARKAANACDLRDIGLPYQVADL